MAWQNKFGFVFKNKKKEREDDKKKSFVVPTADDGAITLQSLGNYGTYLDLEGTVRNEYELISKYRDMALQPECDAAIDDILNDMIIMDEKDTPVSLTLEDLDVPDELKTQLQEAFDDVMSLLDFRSDAYELARKWYVDGRLFFHVIIDEANPKNGILELRFIDPRQIRKVQEVRANKDPDSGADIYDVVDEYFVYSKLGLPGDNINANTYLVSEYVGQKISPDSICYVHSGIVDKTSKMIIGHMHKAIRAVNQLRLIEDAMVIYRISRAPERRIFYIDIGNMPKNRAEQYLRGIMNNFKNKIIYDASTGEVKDGKRHMSMLEDIWLPRREGSNKTEVVPLPGGKNLGDIQDVEYFQKKVYESLNVPLSRMQTTNGFNLGKSTEITRDELKFARFINRLRRKFSVLFIELMGKQLILKKILAPDEWEVIQKDLKFDFVTDNHFSELKEAEILTARLTLLATISLYEGKYYSREFIQRNVLHQTDEDIKLMKKQMDSEKAMLDQEKADAAAVQSGTFGQEPEGEAQDPEDKPNRDDKPDKEKKDE